MLVPYWGLIDEKENDRAIPCCDMSNWRNCNLFFDNIGLWGGAEMTPNQIINGMRQKNTDLQAKTTELLDLAEKKAQTERAYLIARAETTLRLKGEGFQVTLIPSLVKGDKVVANLKYEADIAEAVWDSCKKQIYAINTAIDTYRSILSFNKEEYRQSGVGQT